MSVLQKWCKIQFYEPYCITSYGLQFKSISSSFILKEKLENVFMKHYAPNYMLACKQNRKGDNSVMDLENLSKVNQVIYT